MLLVVGVGTFFRAWLFGSAAIALENLALRHQLRVLQRSGRRPRLARWDRVLWVGLCRVWAGWRSSLVIVQPATVLAGHRQGFPLYWRWKSRPNPVGRPSLDPELRALIRRMARENPTWGRRRLRAELALLGYEVAELTVAKYMHRPSPRPSPTWRAFLAAHARELAAIDFFVVPTLTFRLLCAFVVLRHHRRELVHFNVTDHPTAAWIQARVSGGFSTAIMSIAGRHASASHAHAPHPCLGAPEAVGPMGFLTRTGVDRAGRRARAGWRDRRA